jgi:hypothetical protein
MKTYDVENKWQKNYYYYTTWCRTSQGITIHMGLIYPLKKILTLFFKVNLPTPFFRTMKIFSTYPFCKKIIKNHPKTMKISGCP